MPESEPALKINLGSYDPTIITRALGQITETINRHFEGHVFDLFGQTTQKNALDKCGECVWFNKSSRFCAVAPQNLSNFECEERETPDLPTRLDHLEARSPERIALVHDLANKLEITADELEQKLYRGLTKFHEPFGLTTQGLLAEIERYGDYSIAQMELIGDGIRLNVEYAVPCLTASTIRKKILAGRSFGDIMRWLLS